MKGLNSLEYNNNKTGSDDGGEDDGIATTDGVNTKNIVYLKKSQESKRQVLPCQVLHVDKLFSHSRM